MRVQVRREMPEVATSSSVSWNRSRTLRSRSASDNVTSTVGFGAARIAVASAPIIARDTKSVNVSAPLWHKWRYHSHSHRLRRLIHHGRRPGFRHKFSEPPQSRVGSHAGTYASAG